MIDALRDRFRARLMTDEGIRLTPYRDTRGFLTIGVGRNLDVTGITATEARIMLDHDIERVERAVRARWPWFESLNETRQIVLLSMAFQMGVAALATFVLALTSVQAGAYESAATHMLQSDWAAQTPMRARRLADMMRTGCDPQDLE